MVQVLNHQTIFNALVKLQNAKRFLEKWGSYFYGTPFRWVLTAESCHWLKRTPKGVLLCMCLHVCVNSDSFCINLYNTAASRDGFILKLVCVHALICVCACMYKCVNILCAYIKAVEIWNTPVLRNKTSAKRSDRQAEKTRAILKQEEDMNWSAFHIVRPGWGLAETDREERSY